MEGANRPEPALLIFTWHVFTITSLYSKLSHVHKQSEGNPLIEWVVIGYPLTRWVIRGVPFDSLTSLPLNIYKVDFCAKQCQLVGTGNAVLITPFHYSV
mgnify:CR=1 FL=1